MFINLITKARIVNIVNYRLFKKYIRASDLIMMNYSE